MFSNWRFNTFSEVMNSVLIEEEEHTIEYHADWNGYGIQLNEGPQLDNPSSVVIVEDVTGGATFTEVPRTQAPGAGQYRVDYAASTYYGTGRVQFNAADNGKKVVVTYYGTGWTVKNNYRQSQLTVPTNMEVEEDATIHGDLTLDGENTGGGNLTVAGDVTVAGDIIGKGLFDQGSGGHNVRLKIIEIGDWNMYSTLSVIVAHGLTLSKILGCRALVRNDGDTYSYDFASNSGNSLGAIVMDSTNVTLTFNDTAIFYENTNFDSTSYNRGWIVIEYID